MSLIGAAAAVAAALLAADPAAAAAVPAAVPAPVPVPVAALVEVGDAPAAGSVAVVDPVWARRQADRRLPRLLAMRSSGGDPVYAMRVRREDPFDPFNNIGAFPFSGYSRGGRVVPYPAQAGVGVVPPPRNDPAAASGGPAV